MIEEGGNDRSGGRGYGGMRESERFEFERAIERRPQAWRYDVVAEDTMPEGSDEGLGGGMMWSTG